MNDLQLGCGKIYTAVIGLLRCGCIRPQAFKYLRADALKVNRSYPSELVQESWTARQ